MGETQSLQAIEESVRQVRKQFEEIVETHRPALWRYCHRLTGSAWDAEDLVQETLAKAFARLSGFWQPLDARPYLFRIASNTWVDSLRRARFQLEDIDAVPEPPDTESPVAFGDTWGAIETLVERLPPRQRVIVLLTQVFDFTAMEVGAMLGLTEGAVKAALHRARTSLRSASAEAGTTGNRARVTAAPPNAVVARYLDAFNRRDPDAILALLDAEATSDIVGVAEEYGAEVIRKYSLSDWAADPAPQTAEPGLLDGRPVVFVFFRTEQHERALGWVITLDHSEDRITMMRGYWFTPDLLAYAAGQLGVPALLHGYRYVPGA